MNECEKSKVRGIVKTYLLLKGREVGTKELLDFINGYNFGLPFGVTGRELAPIMNSLQSNGMGKDISWVYDKQAKQRLYRVESL